MLLFIAVIFPFEGECGAREDSFGTLKASSVVLGSFSCYWLISLDFFSIGFHSQIYSIQLVGGRASFSVDDSFGSLLPL